MSARTTWIVVAGDLNDHPAGGSLGALLERDDLRDAMALAAFPAEARPGPYKTAGKTAKLDYLLLTPELQDKVIAVDVNRRGCFSTLWEPYDDIAAAPAKQRARLQASDHHCLYVDLEI